MSYLTAAGLAVDTQAAAAGDQVFSLIDRHTTIDGTLTTVHDLRVDGRVQGTVNCDGTLFVSVGAAVEATVEAGNVSVSGTLTGAVVCRGRLEIQTSGVVRAEIDTSSLVILEGAVLEGTIRMKAPAPSETADSPSPALTPGAQPTESGTFSLLRRFTSAEPESETREDEDLPTGSESERDAT